MTDQPTDDRTPPGRQYPYAPQTNARPLRSTAQVLGMMAAGVLALIGLFFLAVLVVFAVALNNAGSNK